MKPIDRLKWRWARKAIIRRIRRKLSRVLPSNFNVADYNNAMQLIRNYRHIDDDMEDKNFGHAENKETRHLVIVKADDLRASNFRAFVKLLEIMSLRNLPFTIGLICSEVRLLNEQQISFLSSLDDKTVELWHHGYDHLRENNWFRPFRSDWFEFYNTSYQHQRKHILDGMKLARNTLGKTFSTFGAPAAHTDETTKKVLSEFDDIKVVFNMNVCEGKLAIPVSRSIEERVGTMKSHDVVLEKLVTPDDMSNPIVLQIHPEYWGETDYVEFETLIDFLSKRMNYIFVTAKEYWSYVENTKAEETRAL